MTKPLWPHPVTERTYSRLPHAYRNADAAQDVDPDQFGLDDPLVGLDSSTHLDETFGLAGYPLLRFLALLVDQIGLVEDTGNTIDGGALTDFGLALDRWLSWLAYLTGFTNPTLPNVAEQRTWPSHADARAVGSTSYITSRAARFLTGTQFVRLVTKDQTLSPEYSVSFGLDDPLTGLDEEPFALDGPPTPTPGVWQIRVETVPSETPTNFGALIASLRPAGYRFILGNTTSPSLGLDDLTTGLDFTNVQLD